MKVFGFPDIKVQEEKAKKPSAQIKKKKKEVNTSSSSSKNANDSTRDMSYDKDLSRSGVDHNFNVIQQSTKNFLDHDDY